MAPTVAADAATDIEHDLIGTALLPALQTSGDLQQAWARGLSEKATARRTPTGDGPATRQHSNEPLPAAGVTVAAETAAVGWWDGTGTLAEVAPAIAAQGRCAALGDGWFVLLGSGSLSKVCDGTDGSLTGSPVGVGWVEGFDAEGPYVEVLLVGAAAMGRDTYRAFGELDVVFDGGAFAADFAGCEHRSVSGWSSCRTVVADAAVPPGGFVGVGTVGIEPPDGRDSSSRDAPATPAVQRAALVALYNSTGGANWTRKTNWNTTAPVSDWYGVTTDANGSVTDLYLFRNSLSGAIPTQIGNLTNLTELNLGSNSLSGAIPTQIGNLTNLTELDLGSNSLSGAIPTQIGNLTNLTELDLGSNSLSGAIPTQIGNLTGLRTLDLSWNDWSVPIPAELGSLTSLTHLNLRRVGLSGLFPAWVRDLASLTFLNLGGNSLSGSIPPWIGDLANLTQLWLGVSGVSGPIPSELGDLSRLTHLDLQVNVLWGLIPAEFGDLSSLELLNLEHNGLWGPIPTELGELARLRFLKLNNNSLSGCVPSALSSVRFIEFDSGLRYCHVRVGVISAERLVGTPSAVRPGAVALIGLRLVDAAGDELDYTAVRAEISAGSSVGERVRCSAPRATVLGSARLGVCITDGEGRIVFSYRVSTSVSLSRQSWDSLRIYIDEDGDSAYDEPPIRGVPGEPVYYYGVRIAKPVSYVALGDSYSAARTAARTPCPAGSTSPPSRRVPSAAAGWRPTRWCSPRTISATNASTVWRPTPVSAQSPTTSTTTGPTPM